MMTDPDVMKEFLRDAFMSGALDLGRDRKYLEGFVRIFAGEMEALVAVSQATWLDLDEKRKLLETAKITRESAGHFRSWSDRIAAMSRQDRDTGPDRDEGRPADP